MKLIAGSIFISTSLFMFFINGIVKNIAGYYLQYYEYPLLHSIVPWIPWLTLIIGLYPFYIYL